MEVVIDYKKYINSPQWKHKRLLRLKVDRFKCRTCGETENLECHHVTYDRLGNEDLEDLITLCKACHKAITNVIRDRRYKSSPKNLFSIEKKEVLNYVETSKISVDWDSSPDYAQRSTGRSNERGSKSDEKDFWETF